MRHQGKISIWKDEQGFGFITPNEGGDQVFIHIKSFVNRRRRPDGNEIVNYELTTDARGRPQAKNVSFVTQTPVSAPSNNEYIIPIAFLTVFLVFLIGMIFANKLPFAVLWFYFFISAATLIAYAIDKSAAVKKQWRTAESTLHFFALLGGWPGAIAAQRLLRHKSKKQSFQIVFLATIVIHCCLLCWLSLSADAEGFRAMIGQVWGRGRDLLATLFF